MNNIYELVKKFKKKYPGTVAWRLKQNAMVVQKHINPDENVLYAFAGQKNNRFYDIITTAVVVITDKRILIGSKRVLWGYFLTSITPDLFNDLKVSSNLIWGMVTIDTVKELVYISNLSKRALDEIETNVTQNMMNQKKEYGNMNLKRD